MRNPWHVFPDGRVERLPGDYRANTRTFKLKSDAVVASKKFMAEITRKQFEAFPAELVTLMDKAHRLGLHTTGHALHEAVKKLGWELAEKKTKKP